MRGRGGGSVDGGVDGLAHVCRSNAVRCCRLASTPVRVGMGM